MILNITYCLISLCCISIIILVIAEILSINKKSSHKPTAPTRKKSNKPISPDWIQINLSNNSHFYKRINPGTNKEETLKSPYLKTNILSEEEFTFWQILEFKCEPYHIRILPKVHLQSFINIIINNYKNEELDKTYLKLSDIDFVLCDKNLNILACVELYEFSLDEYKLTPLDEFKELICNEINIPLYRIEKYKKVYISSINKILSDLKLLDDLQENS